MGSPKPGQRDKELVDLCTENKNELKNNRTESFEKDLEATLREIIENARNTDQEGTHKDIYGETLETVSEILRGLLNEDAEKTAHVEPPQDDISSQNVEPTQVDFSEQEDDRVEEPLSELQDEDSAEIEIPQDTVSEGLSLLTPEVLVEKPMEEIQKKSYELFMNGFEGSEVEDTEEEIPETEETEASDESIGDVLEKLYIQAQEEPETYSDDVPEIVQEEAKEPLTDFSFEDASNATPTIFRPKEVAETIKPENLIVDQEEIPEVTATVIPEEINEPEAIEIPGLDAVDVSEPDEIAIPESEAFDISLPEEIEIPATDSIESTQPEAIEITEPDAIDISLPEEIEIPATEEIEIPETEKIDSQEPESVEDSGVSDLPDASDMNLAEQDNEALLGVIAAAAFAGIGETIESDGTDKAEAADTAEPDALAENQDEDISQADAGKASETLAAEVPAEKPKKRKKRLKNWIKVLIILVELVALGGECFAIYNISWDHILKRREIAVAKGIASFDSEILTADIGRFVKKAKKSVTKEMDEEVWTTDAVNYRTGPGTEYEKVGTLNQYTSVRRIGTTYNDWSQVEIDGEKYYVLSEYLSNEAPMITETGAKGEYQRYALSQLGNYGWAAVEIYPLIKLWDRESGWNPNSHNRGSGAHGIPQALPASKMASEGSDYYTNGNTQIRWGLGYIASRYGSPSAAWAHFSSHGWY